MLLGLLPLHALLVKLALSLVPMEHHAYLVMQDITKQELQDAKNAPLGLMGVSVNLPLVPLAVMVPMLVQVDLLIATSAH